MIYRDLPSEFGLRDIELLRALFNIVAANPGAIINYREVSKNLGRDQRTVSDYFEYLEYGLLTRFVYNYRGSPLASARKAKKVYLGTPNLALTSGQEKSAVLLENFVLMKTGARFFYRDGFEADFVLAEGKDLTAIEVKEKGTDARQLKLFDRKFRGRVKRKLLITMERRAVEGAEAVPAWEFALF